MLLEILICPGECVLMIMYGTQQVHVGSQLPNVQLLLPSAADPEPESFVMTQDLFNSTSVALTARLHAYL